MKLIGTTHTLCNLARPGQRKNKTEHLLDQAKKISKDSNKKCETFKLYNKSNIKFVHLPYKEAETDPWEKLYVEIIVPNKIICKEKSK